MILNMVGGGTFTATVIVSNCVPQTIVSATSTEISFHSLSNTEGIATIEITAKGVYTITNSGRYSPNDVIVSSSTTYSTRMKSVPNEYQEVEYLGFVANAYIDTGVIPTNHLTVMKVNDVAYVNDKHWIGTNGTPNPAAQYHFTTYNNTYYWFLNEGGEGHAGTWSSGEHYLQFNKGSNHSVVLDDVVLSTQSSTTSSNASLCIGRRGTTANASSFRVIEFALYNKSDETAKIVDYVPCYRKSDSVAGLYDVVNNTFKTNAGSGTFTVGGDVN